MSSFSKYSTFTKQFIRTSDDKRNFPELVNKVAFVKKKEVEGKEIKFTYLRKAFKTGPLPGKFYDTSLAISAVEMSQG